MYGFWDGGRTFRVRFVATAPGEWRWTTGSNQPGDAGLNAGSGSLRAVAWRKRQGFNSVSLIAAFPNWDADARGATFANEDGIFLRNAWEKFGMWAPGAKITTGDGAIINDWAAKLVRVP